MATGYQRAAKYLQQLLGARTRDDLRQRLAPKFGALPPNVPGGSLSTRDAVDNRWHILNARAEARAAVADPGTLAELDRYDRCIEHFVGTVKVPVGVAGPLRVNGLFAQGDYYVPLATTEAALVASYSRGARLISEAGGASALLLNEGVGRAPGFVFRTIRESGEFVAWVLAQVEEFRRVAEGTTLHGRLEDVRLAVEGNHVYLQFEFKTGDAAGQNMVTLAAEAICRYIQDHSPISPQAFFVEANFSGDKKASALSFLGVRGRKVSAEVLLPAELIRHRLHTTPKQMADYGQISTVGGVMSGTIGVQGHYANGLAALYLACGQDAACVAESAVGVTRFEVDPRGGLYAAVTLPNLIVGTVGGGTSLPSQRACLEILGLAGSGKAQALAEVCAALALAGELSIVGALCAGEFARAHERLRRWRSEVWHAGRDDGR